MKRKHFDEDSLHSLIFNCLIYNGYIGVTDLEFNNDGELSMNFSYEKNIYEDDEEDGDTIEDGFGSEWSAWCPKCGEKSMEVVRPGKVQCGNCG